MTSLSSNNCERELWNIGSDCLIFSRSKDKWFYGEVIEINGYLNTEWITVRYGSDNKNIKRIQRNCKYIKPIPFYDNMYLNSNSEINKSDALQFQIGSKCRIYSHNILLWCDAIIINTYKNSNGEWLTIKYNENNFNTICHINRYSKYIQDINSEIEEKNQKISHEKDLEIFDEIKHILIDEQTLSNRIKELGNEITQYYKNNNLLNDNSQLICIGILNGGFMFCSDLIRSIKIAHRVEFMKLKSYSGAKQSDNIQILLDLKCDITNQNILIIEDLIDTGKTMVYLIKYLKSKNAKSIKIACLLQKKTSRFSNKNFHKNNIIIDWIGFPSVCDEWIVGYGIDYNYNYRHLPYIASLKENVYKNH